MDIDMQFLHNGPPKRQRATKSITPVRRASVHPRVPNYTKWLLAELLNPNISSFSFISMQYDHEVQAGSVLKPLQGRGMINGAATVVRPVLSSQRGVVLSYGLYPSYSEINPYGMAACAIDTAIRNAVAVGADIDHVALLDNFCWCSANDPVRLGQLRQSAKACFDYAVAYGTPFISGKDSMFNDFHGFDEKGRPITISIPPTLLISSIGVIPDVTKAVSLDAKMPGDLVYLLGDSKHEFDDTVPEVDAEVNKKLYRAYYRCVQKNLIASAISVSSGGLLVALAKTAMGGLLGLDITLHQDVDSVSQSQGRIVVTVAPSNKRAFESALQGDLQGSALQIIGRVTDDGMFNVKNAKGKSIVHCTVSDMVTSYRKTFKDY